MTKVGWTEKASTKRLELDLLKGRLDFEKWQREGKALNMLNGMGKSQKEYSSFILFQVGKTSISYPPLYDVPSTVLGSLSTLLEEK